MPNPLAAGDSIAPAPAGQGRKTQRRGGGGWARSALKERGPGAFGPGPALLFGGPGAAHRAAPGLPNAAAPGDRPVLSSPPGNRRRAAGAALPQGRRLAPGLRRGGGGVWQAGGPPGPLPAKRKSGGPGQRPGLPLFQGASRPRRPPRERWNFSALSDKTPVFPLLFL